MKKHNCKFIITLKKDFKVKDLTLIYYNGVNSDVIQTLTDNIPIKIKIKLHNFSFIPIS